MSQPSWPPTCAMPDCDQPGLVGTGREVDFGAAGVRFIERLCEDHLARLAPEGAR